MTEAFQLTEEQQRMVRQMVACGTPQDDIPGALGIRGPTLRKYFRRELDTGAIEANTKVAATLFVLATVERNVAACIFWLKTRALARN